MNDWSAAADDLETILSIASRLVSEGEHLAFDLPGERPSLSGPPPAELEQRIVDLAGRAESAMQALAGRRAEIAEELRQVDRIRAAGRGYRKVARSF